MLLVAQPRAKAMENCAGEITFNTADLTPRFQLFGKSGVATPRSLSVPASVRLNSLPITEDTIKFNGRTGYSYNPEA